MNLYDLFEKDKANSSVCKDLGNLISKQEIIFNKISKNKLTLSDIYLLNDGDLSFGDENRNELFIDDVGNLCAFLICFSKLSIQKAKTFLESFLNGVYFESKYITMLKSNRKELFNTILICLKDILNNHEKKFPNIQNENRVQILQNIDTVINDPPENIIIFLNTILGTGKFNTGGLDGNFISKSQIIYRKRDASEFSINITNRCPNACVFCIRDSDAGWNRKDENGEELNLYLNQEPNFREIRQAIKHELSLWDSPPALIKFCGYGEPILCYEIILRTATYLKKISPRSEIQLNTSGWPIVKYFGGKKAFAELKEAGIDTLSISLNAPTKAIYDKIVRPGCYEYEKNAFDNTLLSIKIAKEFGFKVKCSIVKLPNLEKYIHECEYIAEQFNAFFFVREFEGRSLPGMDKNGLQFIEKEAKILNINRNEIIKKLKDLGAEHSLSGLTKLYHYDIPENSEVRKKIRNIIKSNRPEYRSFYPILSIILECVEENLTLHQKLGFLRVRVQQNETALIYKEVETISQHIKNEKEFYYKMESEEFAKALLQNWRLEKIRYIEKNRETYLLDGIIFDIDTWPKLGTYLEIEAEDEMRIFQGLSKLEIPKKKAIGLHTESLFNEMGLQVSNLTFSKDEIIELGI